MNPEQIQADSASSPTAFELVDVEEDALQAVILSAVGLAQSLARCLRRKLEAKTACLGNGGGRDGLENRVLGGRRWGFGKWVDGSNGFKALGLITPVSLPFSLSSSGSTATLGDGGGLFLLRRSSARNGATVAAPTMAPPVLPFPDEAEHSGCSANGPFQLARQDRESFPPLVLMMQGSSDGAGISDLHFQNQAHQGDALVDLMVTVKERKGWSITIHDLSGSPVEAASMVKGLRKEELAWTTQ
nr:uncharacterized protein LOC110886779 [Ipomoea batatas]GMC62938.1 uncharacterized protein LOC110886779 [Ipomoea batatas]